jgi:hypothetical protein
MTLLYLTASYLVASKVIEDLGAFTPESPKRVDLSAFGIIGLLLVVLALAFPPEVSSIDVCGISVCWSPV